MIQQFAAGLAMPLLLLLALLVLLCLVWMARLFARLRNFEPDPWNDLGQPDLLINHTPAMYWRLCRFLYGPGRAALRDAPAAGHARILAGLYKATAWTFGALLLALVLANALRR